MFWRKPITTAEEAVGAVSRIEDELDLLQVRRGDALSDFRAVANELAEINDELGQKSALCGSLISQLQRSRDCISKQVEDNDKVRMKILDIIGE